MKADDIHSAIMYKSFELADRYGINPVYANIDFQLVRDREADIDFYRWRFATPSNGRQADKIERLQTVLGIHTDREMPNGQTAHKGEMIIDHPAELYDQLNVTIAKAPSRFFGKGR